jgi:hypothetical protein
LVDRGFTSIRESKNQNDTQVVCSGQPGKLPPHRSHFAGTDISELFRTGNDLSLFIDRQETFFYIPEPDMQRSLLFFATIKIMKHPDAR